MAAFHPIATSVRAGTFTWNMVTGEIVCEPDTYRLHGLEVDPAATMDTFLSRVPPSELPDVLSAMERLRRACGGYQFEYRVLGADGSMRSLESRGHVLPGESGAPETMIGLVVDVTEIAAAREAEQRQLREAAERAAQTHRFTAALASAATVDEVLSAARAGLLGYSADSLVVLAEREVVASFGADDVTVLDMAVRDLADAAISSGAMAARSGGRSWAAIPVPDSRGRPGACLFGFPGPREFPAVERILLFSVAGLLASSLERARMYEAEHALARELQRGMLPRAPLAVPGVTVATRYLPATSGMEIGGDFYDVFGLRDGSVGLVIGDVQGHNVIAASLMGRLRTAVSAYARSSASAGSLVDPAEVMTRANEWLAELNDADPDMALFATCCFAVLSPLSPRGGVLSVCRAGHPQPLLAVPGASPRLLDCEPGGLPLGITADAGYMTTSLRVTPGTTLVLTTDGLTECDGDDPEYNVNRLLREMTVPRHPEELADRLLAMDRRPPRQSDDVALLVARID